MGSSWWVDSQPGPTFPGGTTTGGGGSYRADQITYRSPLDASRASQGRVPGADYPDGYLGTIIDRHQDKLLNSVQERLSQRSYQRGVHKGSKVSPEDYYWPADRTMYPEKRLEAEARYVRSGYTMDVERFAPTGNPVEKLAHMGKTAGLSAPEQMAIAKQYGVSVAKNPVVLQDPTRIARMQKMLPRYAM